VLGFVLVAQFNPDSGEAGVDMDVIGIEFVRGFRGGERFLILGFREANFGQCVPGGEGFRVGFGDGLELVDGSGAVADGEVESCVVDLILQRSVRHGVFLIARSVSVGNILASHA